MSSGTMLNRVMDAFKAPTNYGRYFVGPGITVAQHFVDQMTPRELRGFGLDKSLIAERPDPMQPIISFGPFGSKVDAPSLFKRLDQLFEIGRLPESKYAEATISSYQERWGSFPISVLTLFAAMKAAGAGLSSNIVASFTKSDGTMLPVKGTVAGLGKLEATFEQDDVRLTCGTEVLCQVTRHEDGEYGPIKMVRLGETMSLEASLPTHGLAMMGHRVLENGLRAILGPMFDSDIPFQVCPWKGSLLVAVRNGVANRYLQEASQELGIGMDGTVTLPG